MSTHVGASSNSTFGTSTSVPAVAGSASGDVAVAFASINTAGSTYDASTIFIPPAGAGWTYRGGATAGTTGENHIAVYTRTLTGALGAETWGSNVSHNFGVAVVVRRGAVEPTTAGTVAVQANPASVVAPAVTIPSGADVIRFGYGGSNGPGSWSRAGTALTSRTGPVPHLSVIEDTVAAANTYSWSATSSAAAAASVVLETAIVADATLTADATTYQPGDTITLTAGGGTTTALTQTDGATAAGLTDTGGGIWTAEAPWTLAGDSLTFSHTVSGDATPATVTVSVAPAQWRMVNAAGALVPGQLKMVT